MIENTINFNLHEGIGMSPYEAQTGRVPDGNIHRVVIFPKKNRVSDQDNVDKRVLSNLKRTYQTRRRRHHRIHKTDVLRVGELVFIKNMPRSNHSKGIMKKLCPLFIGPFKVKYVKGQNVYGLEDADGQFLENVNIRRLKRFVNP